MNLGMIVSVKEGLFRDSFWALLGNVFGRGLALLAGILIARFLGSEAYGEYGLIKTTLLNIAIFTTLGFGYTSTRFIAIYKKKDPSLVLSIIRFVILITLGISLLTALFIFIYSSDVADMIEAPHLSTSIKYLSVIIIFNAVNTSQIALLSGIKAFKSLALNNILTGIVTFVLSVLLAYFFSFSGAMLALLLSQCFNCAINYLTLRRKTSLFNNLSTASLKLKKEIVYTSIPIALQELIFTVTQWGGSFLLIKMSNYTELGLYSAAAQWAGVILFIPSILRNVTLSHLSDSIGGALYIKTLKTMLVVNFISVSILSLSVFVFSQYITNFYGESYEPLSLILKVFVIIPIIDSLSSVFVQVLLSLGKNWSLFFLRLVRDTSTVGLTYVLMVFTLKLNTYHGALLFTVSNLFVQFVFLLVISIYSFLLIKKSKQL